MRCFETGCPEFEFCTDRVLNKKLDLCSSMFENAGIHESNDPVPGLVDIVLYTTKETKSTLLQTLDSILSLDLFTTEMALTVVCDGRGSKKPLKNWRKPRNTRIFYHSLCEGVGYSRYESLRDSRGEWVMFLESGDLLKPQDVGLYKSQLSLNERGFAYTFLGQGDVDSVRSPVIVRSDILPKGAFDLESLKLYGILTDKEVKGIEIELDRVGRKDEVR